MLRLLIKASEQLGLFGGEHQVPVRGHVRRTGRGVVPVVQHRRMVEGQAQQPTPAAPAPPPQAPETPAAPTPAQPPPAAPAPPAATGRPWAHLTPEIQAAFDTAMVDNELTEDAGAEVYQLAEVWQLAGDKPWDKAAELAAQHVKVQQKLREIVTLDAVRQAVPLLGHRGGWASFGAIWEEVAGNKVPWFAVEDGEAMARQHLAELMKRGEVVSYYSSEPETGPWTRYDLEAQAAEDKKRKVVNYQADLAFQRNARDKLGLRLDEVRSAWSSMPRSVRAQWRKLHEAELKAYDTHAGMAARLHAELTDLGASPVGEDPPTYPPDDPDAPWAQPVDVPLGEHEQWIEALPEGALISIQHAHETMPSFYQVQRRGEVPLGPYVEVPSISRPLMPWGQGLRSTMLQASTPGLALRSLVRGDVFPHTRESLAELHAQGHVRLLSDGPVPETVLKRVRQGWPEKVTRVDVDGANYYTVAYRLSPGEVLDAEGKKVRRKDVLSRVAWAIVEQAAGVDFMHKAKGEVRFYHPDSGQVRSGRVVAQGGQGATVHDPETGQAHRVPHGRYWQTDARPPAEGGDSTSTPAGEPKKKPVLGPDGKEEVEPTLPGLDEKKPAGAAGPKAEAMPGVDLDSMDPHDRPAAREGAQDRLAGLEKVGQSLPRARQRMRDHRRLGGLSEAAVCSVLLSALEGSGASPEQLLQELPVVEDDHVQVGPARVDDPAACAVIDAMLKRWGTWQTTAGPVTEASLEAYARRTAGVGLDDLRRFRVAAMAGPQLRHGGERRGLPSERAKVLRGAVAHVHKHVGVDHDQAADLMDPSMVQAFHGGLSWDPKGEGVKPVPGLTSEESHLVHHVGRVREAKPWGDSDGEG